MGWDGSGLRHGLVDCHLFRSVPAYFVVVDAEGEVKDYIKLNHFMKRQNSRIKQEAESKVCMYVYT